MPCHADKEWNSTNVHVLLHAPNMQIRSETTNMCALLSGYVGRN